MIKPNEYRIGNHVCWNPALTNPASTFPALIIEITAVLNDKVGYISPGMEHRSEPFEDDLIQAETHFKPLEELEPIAFSPQLLEKIGFVDDKLETPSGQGINFIHYKNGKVAYQHIGGTPLSHAFSFLHELQNLYYAITGEELDMGGN